ncbi:MAG: GSCFA domain-containing protein [Duncaniella sp.]|nr:GSCFA domain-containing protein [Duncaniella sp.]
MEFRTTVTPHPFPEGTVSHGSPILLIGSCFSDNIGELMRDRLFEVTVNPFGPLYNPLSILAALERLERRELLEASYLFSYGGMCHSFDFHSRYSRSTSDDALAAMNGSIARAADALRSASTVIITLGTVRVFRLCSQGHRPVANCHKLPASEFSEERLTLEQTSAALEAIAATVGRVNPDARIVFTISPLRYLGGGAHDNLIIKSTLALALEQTLTRHPGMLYFPAYEIMMDDLRDYRFYAEDMRHPSAVAVDYIFGKFMEASCSPATIALAADSRRLTRRLAHREMSGNDEANDTLRRQLAADFASRHPSTRTALSRLIQF